MDLDKEALISDIFFNMVDRFNFKTSSQKEFAYLAFSKVLDDCGINKSPKQIREDYQQRL